MRDFDYRLPPTLNHDQERAAEGNLGDMGRNRDAGELARLIYVGLTPTSGDAGIIGETPELLTRQRKAA